MESFCYLKDEQYLKKIIISKVYLKKFRVTMESWESQADLVVKAPWDQKESLILILLNLDVQDQWDLKDWMVCV